MIASWQDFINGSFELFGGLFLLKNVIQLHRDKLVRGVHWVPTTFFMLWGVWNLYYYPHLDQWWSFTGGLLIVSVNAIWVGQMLYYGRKEGKPMRNIMLDIETLGTEPQSVILAAAAQEFDDDGPVGDGVFVRFPVQPQLDKGRTVSEATLRFWAEQNQKLFERMLNPQYVNIYRALADLEKYFQRHSDEVFAPVDPVVVWANSPNFDAVLMESLFRRFGFTIPWSHRDLRDVRTLRSLAAVKADWAPYTDIPGEPHDPLYDCRWQIALVIHALDKLEVLL